MSVRCFQRGLTAEGRPFRNIGGPSHGHGARQGSGFPVICFVLYLVPCLWLMLVVGNDNWGDHTQMLSHFIPSTLGLNFSTNSLNSKAYLYLNLLCYVCWQPWDHMDAPSSNFTTQVSVVSICMLTNPSWLFSYIRALATLDLPWWLLLPHSAWILTPSLNTDLATWFPSRWGPSACWLPSAGS